MLPCGRDSAGGETEKARQTPSGHISPEAKKEGASRRRRKEIRRTSGNVRREIEHELRRSGGHGDGVETVGGGHSVRCASVDRDGPLADPARDADLIGEWFRRPDRRGERVPERVERVHRDGDFVRCETEAEVCQSRVAMPLTCLRSCERRAR